LSTTTPPTPAERDFPLGEPGFHYQDLHREDRLAQLDRVFLDRLAAEHPELHARLEAYRANPGSVGALDRSRLLIEAARPVGEFVARLFGVEAEWRRQGASAGPEAVLFRFRRDFLMRRAVKTKLPPDLEHFDPSPLRATASAIERELHPDLPWDADPELATAEMAVRLLDVEAEFIATIRQKKKSEISSEARAAARALAERAAASASTDLPRVSGNSDEELLAFLHKVLERYALWCHLRREHPALRAGIKGWISFKLPETLDYQNLVATDRLDPALPERRMGPASTHRRREGFRLTDPRMTRREILGETHYCLLCHDREKDSCSKGFFDAKTSAWQKNPLGIALKGCPLDEKISEMHQLRREGDSIGALALVAIDNPMCPGTGHRICNDCMKGCIFQKQDPVNIPQIETGVLTDVLALPWGVEIYGLLTRWNPLHPSRPSPRPYTGKKVLVVGLGPAGYTLAHYLLNEGCGVVGIDGLKIEPLPEDITGADGGGIRPVRDWSELALPLDERPLAGFGGVSEYGITVRWEKNFLTLIQLTLARRRRFTILGGVRFGGALNAEQAFDAGFDHVAIAAGAGRPTIIPMKNNVIRGVRKASDFLMALQLTGAFKEEALANLQLELPAVVIGGGLTAIDTATELLAYYPIQAEKTLARYAMLCSEKGEDAVRATFDAEERDILDRLLAHGLAVHKERERSHAAGEIPDLARLCREWGGVAIAYRRAMEESPAYRLNHEEIIKALEEGISFVEGLEPQEAVPDEHGKLKAMRFLRGGSGETVELPARTCLVAAGTTPNITYAKEFPDAFPLDAKRRFFAPHKAVRSGAGYRLEPAHAEDESAFFTGFSRGGKFVTFFGDNHPAYNGNVVKAMASARNGYREIARVLDGEGLSAVVPDSEWDDFTRSLAEAH